MATFWLNSQPSLREWPVPAPCHGPGLGWGPPSSVQPTHLVSLQPPFLPALPSLCHQTDNINNILITLIPHLSPLKTIHVVPFIYAFQQRGQDHSTGETKAVFSKQCWKVRTSTCKRMTFDPYLTSYTKPHHDFHCPKDGGLTSQPCTQGSSNSLILSAFVQAWC